MAKHRWWPRPLLDQLTLMQHFKVRIAYHAEALGLTPAEVEDAIGLCEAFEAAYTYTERCRNAVNAVTVWRDDIFEGEGPPLPGRDPVKLPEFDHPPLRRGIVPAFHALRRRIVAAPRYVPSIGYDLGIIGGERTRRDPDTIVPDLEVSVFEGNFVNLKGSLQGMDAARIEYAPDGEDFRTVAFITRTPGGFYIAPQTPGRSEVGMIRSILIKNSRTIGIYSKMHTIVLPGKA